MKFDRVGLGFLKRNGKIFVVYPSIDKSTGQRYYGGGVQLEYPFGAPDANEITKERVAIIESLEEEVSGETNEASTPSTPTIRKEESP